MEEELECCKCTCKSKKILTCASFIIAGVSLIALGTCLIMKKNKED